MKIGFSLPHMGSIATPENIAYAARFGESEGFDSLWVIDRILWPAEPQTPYPPSPDGSWPEIYQNVIDPISTLTYVAARQEYWSGLPFPSPGIWGVKPVSPAQAGEFLTTEPPVKPF